MNRNSKSQTEYDTALKDIAGISDITSLYGMLTEDYEGIRNVDEIELEID